MLAIVPNALMEVFATYVSLVIISMMITHALIKVYALTMNICTKENAYQNVQITFIFFWSFLLAIFVLLIVQVALMQFLVIFATLGIMLMLQLHVLYVMLLATVAMGKVLVIAMYVLVNIGTMPELVNYVIPYVMNVLEVVLVHVLTVNM